MTGSVEAITTYAIFLVHLVRQTIHIRIIRHGLVESRIKHRYLRNTRDQSLHRPNTLQVSRVMKRSQIRALDYLIDYILIDQYARSELLATMYQTMTNSVDLLIVLDTTISSVGQYAQDKLDALLMAGNLSLDNHLLALLIRQFQERARQTDFLDTTLSHNLTGGHIE